MRNFMILFILVAILSGCSSSSQNPYANDIARQELAIAENAPFSGYSHTPMGGLPSDNAIPCMGWINSVRFAAEGKVLCINLNEEVSSNAVIHVWAINQQGQRMGMLQALSNNVFDLTSAAGAGTPVMFKVMILRAGAADRLDAYERNLVSRENVLVHNSLIRLEREVRRFTNANEILSALPKGRFAPEIYQDDAS